MSAPRTHERIASARALAIGALLTMLAAIAILIPGLGMPALRGDEGAYAAIALESEHSGAAALPVVLGEPWINKPPMTIWLQRFALRALGPSEWAVRLPSALAGIALGLLLYFGVARDRGAGAGLASALLLLATPGLLENDGAHGLRSGTTDALLLLLLSAAIFAGRDAMGGVPGRLQGSALAVALATWTKSLNALHAVVVLGGWSLIRRAAGAEARGRNRRVLLALASIVALAFLLWLTAAALLSGENPIHHLVWQDLVQRATAPANPRHVQGLLFYPRLLARDFGPFLLLAAWGLARSLRAAREAEDRKEELARLAAAWALAPLLLLSLSRAKLPWYLFPSYPGWALLAVAGGADLLKRARRRGRFAATALLLALLAAAAWRADTAWSAVSAGRPANPLATLEAELGKMPEAHLQFDPDLVFGPRGIRGTNYFYFLRLRAALADRQTGSDCTARLAPVAATGGDRSAWVVRLRRIHRSDADLFLVDRCAGRIASRLLQLDVATLAAGPSPPRP